MNLNSHSQLKGLAGTHSFLSPSNYHWINYDEDKLERVFFANEAARRGTAIHAFAQQAIELGVKLPDVARHLNMYVNDAIGYRMTPEQLLFYSENCYGHADAVGFRNNKLRIHDLKNGVTEASPKQLEVYAALFCLEYAFKPSEIEIETRLYQNDAVKIFTPEIDDIFHIMDKIVTFDKYIKRLKMEAAG